MAKIKINNEEIVNGKLSISRDQIKVAGQLATHKYFEEITEIESERYRISNVEVIREDFGSNDFDILYTFEAKEIDIKGGQTNLPKDVIEHIEEEIYKDEKEELIHKEVYEKWRTDMNLKQ